jgi:hypothetical protein
LISFASPHCSGSMLSRTARRVGTQVRQHTHQAGPLMNAEAQITDGAKGEPTRDPGDEPRAGPGLQFIYSSCLVLWLTYWWLSGQPAPSDRFSGQRPAAYPAYKLQGPQEARSKNKARGAHRGCDLKFSHWLSDVMCCLFRLTQQAQAPS